MNRTDANFSLLVAYRSPQLTTHTYTITLVQMLNVKVTNVNFAHSLSMPDQREQ